MKLFAIGASGKTGVHLIAQALDHSHEVTAFVRSPDKVVRKDARLHVIAGDPLDPVPLAAALRGHDAVLSVIGAPNLGPTTVHTDSARATIEAMKTAGVRRLVGLSSAFMFRDIGLFPAILRRLFFGNIFRDHTEMERLIEASDLDWTLVRPPRLVQGEARGQYRVVDGALPPRGRIVRFADVAHFMLAEAEKPEHTRKFVGLAY